MAGEERSVPFGDLAWADDAPGIRAREARVQGARWAVVEYEEGAFREEWCEEGHRGFVVGGEIEYEFDDGPAPLRAKEGEAFLLPPAPLGGGAHRGRNLAPGSRRLFLIDNAPEAVGPQDSPQRPRAEGITQHLPVAASPNGGGAPRRYRPFPDAL